MKNDRFICGFKTKGEAYFVSDCGFFGEPLDEQLKKACGYTAWVVDNSQKVSVGRIIDKERDTEHYYFGDGVWLTPCDACGKMALEPGEPCAKCLRDVIG